MTLVYLAARNRSLRPSLLDDLCSRSTPDAAGTLELIHDATPSSSSIFIVGGTALLSWPLGRYMKWAMDRPSPPARPNGWHPGLFQSIGGPLARPSQDWKAYMLAMLVFNVVMFVVSFAILALQQYLPLNPDGKGAIERDLIFNTAASFTSNTNLQHYSGEVSLSYLSQLGALMWLQFVSAATGIAALAALARGLAGRPTRQLLRRCAARDVPRAAAGGARRGDAHGARRRCR